MHNYPIFGKTIPSALSTMKTVAKLRLFRKEMKTRHFLVEKKPNDEEIMAYIEMASKAFKNFSEEKQVKMAAVLAADHYLTLQRLENN